MIRPIAMVLNRLTQGIPAWQAETGRSRYEHYWLKHAVQAVDLR